MSFSRIWHRGKFASLGGLRTSFEDPKLLWISGILFLLVQGILTWMIMRVDTPWEFLKHQLSTNVDEFLVTRDNWGPEATRLYLQHYWLDFIHPAIYAVFFRCLLSQIQLFHPTNFVYHSLSFPFAAALYDYMENICHLALMADWTNSKFVFYLGAIGAYGKWLLISGIVLAAAFALWQRYVEGSSEK